MKLFVSFVLIPVSGKLPTSKERLAKKEFYQKIYV